MSTPWLRMGSDSVDVFVKVVPRASRSRVCGVIGDRLKVQVAAPPVEGEANREVCELLAKAARVPSRAATVSAGTTSRSKTVRLTGDDPASMAAALEKVAAGGG